MVDKPRIKMDDQTTAQIKTDGWLNVLSGYGTSRDPGEATRPRAESGLSQQALEDIYRGDGIGRRIVDLFAEEMTRKWITVEGDQGEQRLKQLADLEAKQQFNRALRWAGLYGGSVMVMLINDGQGDLSQPLNTNTIRSVNELIVYDRHQVSWRQESISDDPNSMYFGRAEVMTIQPLLGTPYPIHRSRVLVFDGEDVPDRIRQQNSGWGDSRLQAVYRALGRYAEGMGSASSILRDFIL
ncbi:MAG: anti-CBASS Acb1 family protein, partial [Natronospirillum sp.]